MTVVRSGGRLASLVLVVALLVGLLTGCGDDEDPGDLEAFCALVHDGKGMLVIASGEVPAGSAAAEFEELTAVAPAEIRSAVRRVANRERDLGEIDDLEELFDAAFSPSALQAREDYRDFVLTHCEVDVGEVVETEPVSLVRGLRAFINETATGEDWTTKVIYSEDEPLLQEKIVTVTFRTRPIGDEDFRACNAVSAYVYDEVAEEGTVIAVVFNDVVRVQRLGAATTCAEPK